MRHPSIWVGIFLVLNFGAPKKKVARVSTFTYSFFGAILAVECRHSNYIVTGGFGKRVVIRRLSDLAIIYEYPPCQTSIRAVAIAYNQQRIIAGLASGQVASMKCAIPM